MNEAETRKAAEVMLAAEWVDGDCVNVEVLHSLGWVDANEPSWNWFDHDYRIKPKAIVRYHNVYSGEDGVGYGTDTVQDARALLWNRAIDRLRITTIDGVSKAELIGLEADE